MKSSAPALMPATAIGTSAWPEMSTTGSPILRRASSRTSSIPSVPGMRTSATTQPSCGSGGAARKLSADSIGLDREAEHAQHLAERVAHRLLIVDHENGRSRTRRASCLFERKREAELGRARRA